MVDRSQELYSAVEVLSKEGGDVGVRAPVARRPPSTLLPSSQTVAKGLRATSGLVKQLSALAQRKSMFDDPTTAINRLTGVINSNVQSQTTAIKQLVQFVNDHSELQPNSRQHWLQVAEVLRAHLLANTRHFQEAIRTTAASVKATAKRKNKYQHARHTPLVQLDSPLFQAPSTGGGGQAASQPAPVSGAGAVASGGGPAPGAAPAASAPPALPRPMPAQGGGLRRRAAPPNGADAGGVGTDPLTTATAQPGGANYAPKFPTGGVAARQVAQIHVGRRNTQVRKYEQMVADIGRMFTQMTSLVALQGETVERIDKDVEAAAGDIKGGETELFKYFQSVTRDRRFIVKVFAVLVVLILFIAWIN